MLGGLILKNNVIQRLRDSAEVKLRLEAEADRIVEIARVWSAALRRGNKILFCGNGGSAADAQHLAAELVGRFGREREALPGLALSVDTSILTAIGNDYGYDQVFARQVAAYGHSGDVLVGITTSGRSLNVLGALEVARQMKLSTIALTGSGGLAKDVADYVLSVPSSATPRIQEAHITVGHIICELVEEDLFGSR